MNFNKAKIKKKKTHKLWLKLKLRLINTISRNSDKLNTSFFIKSPTLHNECREVLRACKHEFCYLISTQQKTCTHQEVILCLLQSPLGPVKTIWTSKWHQAQFFKKRFLKISSFFDDISWKTILMFLTGLFILKGRGSALCRSSMFVCFVK